MSEGFKLLCGALIRNVLVYLGGILVARGWLTKEQWGTVDLTPLVAGILVFLTGVGWSLYQKLRQIITVRMALQMHPELHTEEQVYKLAKDVPTSCALRSQTDTATTENKQ